MTSPDASATPPYLPAPYLVDGPGAFLTSAQLVRCFEDFYASLGCVNTAPQMVFERLIGNLGGPVHAALEQARRAGADAANGSGITCLQTPAASVLPSVALPAVMSSPVVPPTTAVPTTPVEQEVRRTPLHVIRSFSVDDCPEWLASTAFVSTKTFVTTSLPDLSKFAIALTSFQMPNSAQVIVSSSITPQDTGFTVSLINADPPGSSSCLKNASCSWLELSDDANDMQCGVWSLPRDDESQRSSAERIYFPMRYDERPQVLVWLNGLSMSRASSRSVKLDVHDRDCSGFTLYKPSASSGIHSLGISWLACPEPRPGVAIGSFHAGERNPTDNVWGLCEGYVSFESGWFKAAPKVVVGIGCFQMRNASHVSLSLQVVHVSTRGMKWRFDGGPDGCFNYVGGSFIAFE